MTSPMTKRPNGTGSVYQRADGRWCAAVPGPDGRRHSRYRYSKREALAALADLQAKFAAGLVPVPGLTVGRYLDGWLKDRKRRVRESTWVSYEGHIRIHLAALRRIPLSRLSAADLRQLVSDLLEERLSPSTVGGALVVLRMALRQAVRDGLVPRNVAEHVPSPKVDHREPRLWTLDQTRTFLASADALWVVLITTGLRLGEALGLRWQDVDLVAGELTVNGALRALPRSARRPKDPRLARVEPKSPSAYRTLTMPVNVQRALAEHPSVRNPVGYIFTTPRGTPIDQRNAQRMWTAATVGYPRIRIHDCRHLAASIALSQGLTLEDVKRMLGHSTITLTSNTYGHLLKERSRHVADIMGRAVAVPVAVSGA